MSTIPAAHPTFQEPNLGAVQREVPDAYPLELFPPALANLIAAVAQKYSVNPAVVGAAVLVATAAALGPGNLVDTWSPTMAPAALNFVLVGKSGAQLQGALETVLFPFARTVQERRLAAQNVNPAALEQNYRRTATEIARQESLGGSTAFTPTKVECGKLLALLRPELLLESMTLSRLKGALAQSADLSLLLAAGRIDAADHWLRLKAAERQELAVVLRKSWDWQASGFPEYPTPIHLPLLWRIGREHAPRFLRCPELFGEPGVPFFLLQLEPALPAGPALAEPAEIGRLWDQLLTTSLERRTCHEVNAYAFSPEAAGALIDYVNQIEARSEALAADQRCFVDFWPEAARRLSLIFALLGAEPGPELSVAVVEAAIGVTEWYGRASLATMRSLRSAATSPDRPAPRQSLRERMLQRIGEKGPIRWRELRRSFGNSSAALLTPIRDQLIAEGLIGWLEGVTGPELALAAVEVVPEGTAKSPPAGSAV